jgi:hypothetical protein
MRAIANRLDKSKITENSGFSELFGVQLEILRDQEVEGSNPFTPTEKPDFTGFLAQQEIVMTAWVQPKRSCILSDLTR